MLGLSKPPGERERAKPFRILIVPGGVYAGGGTIFASENPISQSKNRFLAIFACVAQRREQKLERVVVAGEILPRPPSCQKYFLTRWAFLIHKGMGNAFSANRDSYKKRMEGHEMQVLDTLPRHRYNKNGWLFV